MSNKYIINEVQLGMLVAMKTQKEREDFVMNTIINMQYLRPFQKNVIDECLYLNHSRNNAQND